MCLGVGLVMAWALGVIIIIIIITLLLLLFVQEEHGLAHAVDLDLGCVSKSIHLAQITPSAHGWWCMGTNFQCLWVVGGESIYYYLSSAAHDYHDYGKFNYDNIIIIIIIIIII